MHSIGHRYFTVRRAWRDGMLVDRQQPVTWAQLPPLEDAGDDAGAAEPSIGGHDLDRRRWSGRHRIDLRASVPLPGGRWYVTILAGRERRSPDRLRAEGQTHWLRRATVYVMLMSLVLWLAVCVLVAIYLVKSALGLDLFDGASPLHILYERWLDH